MTETVTPLSETVSQIVRSRTCGCRDFYIAKITQNDATFGQLYENGFLIKTADDKAPEVAVGWRERKLNGKYDFKWLYAGKFAEGISEEASTKEGKLSPTTKSIKGSFYERSLDNAYEISVDESNLVKENTKAAEAIKSWFSKVQEKNDAAA